MKRKIFVTQFTDWETKHFWITAEIIENLCCTPSNQNIAWNGTGTLAKANNRYYLGYHNGNGNSHENFVEISEQNFIKIKKMSDNGVEGDKMLRAVLSHFE